jgi:hypothetical protein
MAAKDTTEKILLSHNDVFADIINGLIFHGRQVVKSNSLQDRITHAQFKADDNQIHEEERDVIKAWTDGKIDIMMCGFENQTAPFKLMPARVIAYDGASYKSQLLADESRNQVVPVATLVLYFGKEHWNQPTTLKEVMSGIPEGFEPYVNDYKIHVFEIAWLTDDEIDCFKSDFKIVANFFSKKRRFGEDYVPDDSQEIKHVDEVLKLLSAFTKDSRFAELLREPMERRINNMCEVVDRLEKKGFDKGVAQGIVQGEEKTTARDIKTLAKNLRPTHPDFSEEELIAEATRLLTPND